MNNNSPALGGEEKPINNVFDVGQLIRDGFTDWEKHGRVNVTEWGGLLLFNYKAEAHFEGEWTPFEMMSRGLIMNAKTGACVALPFSKFFNYGEGGRLPTCKPIEISEKLDGSLGILYRLNGEYQIATRGSFESDQALWATEYLKRFNFELYLTDDITLLFEIIYPDNRIVVDYGERHDLVLIGARNRVNGWDYPRETWEHYATYIDLPVPSSFSVQRYPDPQQLLDELNSRERLIEGFVVKYEDDTRFKFKTEEYKRLHYIIHQLSFGRVLQEVRQGTYMQFVEDVPDEFMNQIIEHRDRIGEVEHNIKLAVEKAYEQAPKSDRKTFALWVQANAPEIAPYMFMRIDNRDFTDRIYQREF